MKRILKNSLALAAVLVLVGCNESENPASPDAETMSDSDEIEAIVAQEMADWFADDFLEGEQDEAAKSAAAIEADRWRRVVESRSGNVSIDFPGDGTAFVTVKRCIEGTLRIADRIDSITTTIYEKPFADSITRYASLTRRPVSDTRPPFRRWSVDGISLAEAVSTPVNTVAIESVSLTNAAAGITCTYTDPAALLDRDLDVPVFEPGDEIELSVDATASGLLAFLHTAGRRVPLADNGDGTYSGTFSVPAREGVHHAGVDLVTPGTLLDDIEAHDNNAWASIYRVE